MTGNTPGTDAIDIQAIRKNGATQAATGQESMAIGHSNTAAGQESMAIGRSNTAAGASSVAVGSLNVVNSSATLGLAFGDENKILAPGASAFGSGITNSIADSLMIGPSDSAKITILPDGNVGIGTAAPASKLNIAGGLLIGRNNTTVGQPAASGAYISSRVTRNDSSYSGAAAWYKFASLPPSNNGNGPLLHIDFVGGSYSSFNKHVFSAMLGTRNGVIAKITHAAGDRSFGMGASGVVMYEERNPEGVITGFSLYIKLSAWRFSGGQVSVTDGSWSYGATFYDIENGSPTTTTTPPGDLVFDSTDATAYRGIFVDYNMDRVGIGTAAPAATFDVKGDAKITGALSVTGTFTPAGPINMAAGQTLSLPSAGKISVNTTATMGGVHVVPTGTIGLGDGDFTAAAFSTATSDGVQKLGIDPNQIVNAGADLNIQSTNRGIRLNAASANPDTAGDDLVITADGNVGIGTTTAPQAKLHVAGAARIEGPISTAAIPNVVPIVIRGSDWRHADQGGSGDILKIGSTNFSYAGGVGLALTVVSRADYSIISRARYNTYGSAAASADLAAALNALDKSQIGILTSRDAWENSVTTDLRAAFGRLGLTKAQAVKSGSSSHHRHPYAAIFDGASNGKAGGNVIEVMQPRDDADQPYAEIRGWLIDGAFAVTPTTKINSLHSPAGDTQALRVAYNGDVDVKTTLRVPQRGDIGMGAFTTGPNPSN